jgi:hypothetical protein
MNLVAVYNAIGGGWRMRYASDAPLSVQPDTPFMEEDQPDDYALPPTKPLPTEPLPLPSAPPVAPPNDSDPARPKLMVFTADADCPKQGVVWPRTTRRQPPLAQSLLILTVGPYTRGAINE